MWDRGIAAMQGNSSSNSHGQPVVVGGKVLYQVKLLMLVKASCIEEWVS